MENVICKDKIAGSFTGFNRDQLFKLANGACWIQAQFQYWHHIEDQPEVIITEENGRYILTVADHSIPVNRVSDVIESRISGEFKGWDGKSRYTLDNGQVWEQASFKHEYKYADNPEVIIYSTNGGYKMKVEGLEADVRRVDNVL